MSKARIWAIVAVGAALASSNAWAQAAQSTNTSSFARDRNTSVRERGRPGLEALGVRAGGFTVFPRVVADVEHNDNVFATPAPRDADTIFRATPEVAVTSNWSRHEFNILARAVFERYADNDNENTEQYGIGFTSRIDARRGAYLNLGASYDRMVEPRTAPTSPVAAAEPVEYNLAQARAGFVHEFNRLRASGDVQFVRSDYKNTVTTTGAPLLQDDRDRTTWSERGRLEYAVSPDTSIFGEASLNQRPYRLGVGAATFDRDSSGYNLSAGANFDITDLVRGEVQMGYMKQSYDDVRFSDIGAWSFAAAVDWFATPLTTVRLTGSRTIEEPASVASPGFVSTSARAQVDHELLRNLLLTAHAGFGKDDYRQLDRQDNSFAGGVAATYLVNRWVGLRVGYDHQKRESKGLAQTIDFRQNRILGSLTLQY